jgi:DNA-binding transcriptional ArsR family regulator
MAHSLDGKSASTALDADTARLVADAMQALSAPSRLLILGRLRESPCSVGELAEAVGMEQSAVSHQLRLLRHLSLVRSHRDGRKVVYELHDSHVGDLLEQAIYHVEHLRLASAQSHHDREVSA